MWAVIKKEFKNYFCTPIGYVCIGIFLIAFSVSFYFSAFGYGTTNFEAIFYSLPIVLALAFIIPLLTMRTFAEERKTGTEQLLMTSSLSLTKIVLAKFIAALLVVVITELCTFMYFAILSYYGMPDIQTSLVALLGFLLLNMAYISFGILASSLTENQIIAAIITIGFFILNWFLPDFSSMFANFALMDIFSKFIYGQIDVADTVTFIAFTAMCILLTIIVLQRRKSDVPLTFVLIALVIAAFVAITTLMQKLELTPIDLTSQKTYTVSEESKEKVENIEKQVNIYLIGYTDDDSATVVAKQYHKANENINVEAVDITQRKDLAEKYGIDSSNAEGIIVECGDKSKVLSSSDLVSYDTTTYESSDVTEEKLTSAILTVTADEVPNVYFLSGYGSFSLSSGMSYLSMYLQNEIMNVDTLDLLSKGSAPEDCDTLVITTPDKDFEDIVADAIIKYINNGGNILWFNAAYGTTQNLPNVNKVLATYGVSPFSAGYILETDASKMVSGAPYMIKPDIEYTDVTSKIATSEGVLLVQPTKLNMQSEEKLTELKVEKEDLLTASSSSFFRSDLSIESTSKTDKDEAGEFTVGAKLTKTINDEKESTLIIYGENYFISDVPITQNSKTPVIDAYDNKDLALNSMAELTERDEDITIRKSTDTVTTYTATAQETTIITIIIFTVPCIIVIAGIVVWQARRRKK